MIRAAVTRNEQRLMNNVFLKFVDDREIRRNKQQIEEFVIDDRDVTAAFKNDKLE